METLKNAFIHQAVRGSEAKSFTKLNAVLESMENARNLLNENNRVVVSMSIDGIQNARMSKKMQEMGYFVNSPIKAVNQAIADSIISRSALLMILGPVSPSCAAIGEMLLMIAEDPMFGFVVPRISNIARSAVFSMCSMHDLSGDSLLPRRILSGVPRFYVVPELLAPCILIRGEILRNFGLLDTSRENIQSALYKYLVKIRRIGFRGVIANRAVVPATIENGSLVEDVPSSESSRLEQQFPDAGLARRIFEELPHIQAEKIISLLYRPFRKLLLDCTGLCANHNGTGQSIIGVLSGLSSLKTNWEISVLVYQDAARYHRLQQRFSNLKIIYPETEATYQVAIRLSQPWSIKTISDLHKRAPLVVVTILDTIAWDVIYPCDGKFDEFENAWRMASRYSDALFYNSQFTKDRYNSRFPVSSEVEQIVCHHSLDPKEYADRIATEGESVSERYVLVIGNDYDHKDLKLACEVAAKGFPFLSFKALGLNESKYGNLEAIPSGGIPDSVVEKLFANSSYILYPSFYEGFGLPLVKGLSYNKTVLVRDSALVHELARRYVGPGKLVVFDDYTSLFEQLGRLIHGLPIEQEVCLGINVPKDGVPYTWACAARNILESSERLIKSFDSCRWRKRDEIFRLMGDPTIR